MLTLFNTKTKPKSTCKFEFWNDGKEKEKFADLWDFLLPQYFKLGMGKYF